MLDVEVEAFLMQLSPPTSKSTKITCICPFHQSPRLNMRVQGLGLFAFMVLFDCLKGLVWYVWDENL